MQTTTNIGRKAQAQPAAAPARGSLPMRRGSGLLAELEHAHDFERSGNVLDDAARSFNVRHRAGVVGRRGDVGSELRVVALATADKVCLKRKVVGYVGARDRKRQCSNEPYRQNSHSSTVPPPAWPMAHQRARAA